MSGSAQARVWEGKSHLILGAQHKAWPIAGTQ